MFKLKKVIPETTDEALVDDSALKNESKLRNDVITDIGGSSRVLFGVVMFLETVYAAVIAYRAENMIMMASLVISRGIAAFLTKSGKNPTYLVYFMPSYAAVFLMYTMFFTDQVALGAMYLVLTFTLGLLALPASHGLIYSGGMLLLASILYFVKGVDASYSTVEVSAFAAASAMIVLLSYIVSKHINRISRHYEETRIAGERSRIKYEALLNNVGDGVIVTDVETNVEFISQKALVLLGLNKEEVLGHPVASVILLTDDSGNVLKHDAYPVTKVINSHKPIYTNQASESQFSMIRSDNTSFASSMSVSPLVIFGEITGSVMVFTDITEIMQNERIKGEFVSLASHQLRTPLNVVSWYTEKLLSQRKGKLNDKQKDYIDEIHTNNARLIALVGDLLNVSRVDLGRVSRRHEIVNITETIQQLVKEVQPLAESKKVVLSVKMPEHEIIHENSDNTLFTVIVQNLLSNATKYTQDKGSVSVEVKNVAKGTMLEKAQNIVATDAGVLITVSDTGIGIPGAQQDKVFGKLFRADNVQVMDVQGTGLGLYITRSFARALGGAIWFSSTVGKGTAFYVYLPNIVETNNTK